jgi:hypothetical protein
VKRAASGVRTASAPLFARAKIFLGSKSSVRSKARLKPAQSRRFATFSRRALDGGAGFGLITGSDGNRVAKILYQEAIMQPDFSKLFSSRPVTPLKYKARIGACFVHDIHFISSYLHDARFFPNTVTKKGKKLSIEFERDCWELGYTQHVGSLELHIAKSLLTVKPVSEIHWEIGDKKVFEKEIWVTNIYLGSSHWEKPSVNELVISAPHDGLRLHILIADDFGDIRIDDLEVPYLYSSRKAKQEKAK